MADTSLLERRIFEHMLDSGEIHGLEPENFACEEISLMWGAAIECKRARGGLDHVLLGDYILGEAEIDQREWLKSVWRNRIINAEIIPAYVTALKKHNHSRDLTATLATLATTKGDPGERRHHAITALRELNVTTGDKITSAKKAMPGVIAEIETRFKDGNMPGITSGIDGLDRFTGGFQRSDLTIVAARPSVGKTALMLNMALAADCAVGIVSAEQPAEQLVLRMMSMIGRIPAWKLRNPREMLDEHWQRMASVVSEIQQRNIQILDAPAPTIADVSAYAERMDVAILYVDYVQRIKGEGEGIYEQISSVAQSLKELARLKKIPVVALAQINRQGATNPGMQHLKGSGDLEQEADLVIILDRSDEDDEMATTLSLEKNRHGPTGIVSLVFHGPTMTFSEK